MRKLVLAFVLILILAGGAVYSDKQGVRDIYPDTIRELEGIYSSATEEFLRGTFIWE